MNCTYLNMYRDFPGGPVVKNPPTNATDSGSIPGRGTKIPHAMGQLSLRSATTEPAHSGAHVPQLERSPCTAMKSPCTATKRSCMLQRRSPMPQLRPNVAK